MWQGHTAPHSATNSYPNTTTEVLINSSSVCLTSRVVFAHFKSTHSYALLQTSHLLRSGLFQPQATGLLSSQETRRTAVMPHQARLFGRSRRTDSPTLQLCKRWALEQGNPEITAHPPQAFKYFKDAVFLYPQGLYLLLHWFCSWTWPAHLLLLHLHDLFHQCFSPHFRKDSAALILSATPRETALVAFITPIRLTLLNISGSWQYCTLIPLLWGWCRDTQAAEPPPLEVDDSAPPKQVRHCISEMHPASTPWKLGSLFKLIIYIGCYCQGNPGQLLLHQCRLRWVAHSRHMASPPRFSQQNRCQTFRGL